MRFSRISVMMRLVGDSLTLVPDGARFADDRVYVMLPYDDESRLLVGARNQGLFIYDGETFAPFATEADPLLQVHDLYMELAILPDERVLFVERKGAVKLYTPGTEEIKEIAKLSVSTVYENGNVAEDGLLGLALDPGFSENGWIYMFYSPSGDDPKNVLSRFHLDGDVLDLSTERVLLEVPVQRDECCHTGGSITFDAVGNLYLSTGDNTNPHAYVQKFKCNPNKSKKYRDRESRGNPAYCIRMDSHNVLNSFGGLREL